MATKKKITVRSHSRDYYPSKLPKRSAGGRFKKKSTTKKATAKKSTSKPTSKRSGLGPLFK